MNMMRVWGGGIYEHDGFYDLCNCLGLLVWQDFMFACAPYPEDEPAFVDNVRAEIHDQVVRLRNHPSLALWCGNNECQLLHSFVSRATHDDGAVLGSLYYDRLMPEALAALDPATPYWPGSPAGGPSANSMRAGDVHDWTVWHGIPPVPDQDFVGEIDRSPAGIAYTRYAENTGRFISEFGIHSAPPMATLRRRMDPQDLSLESPGFLERIKDEPKDKINGMLLSNTGLPETLEQYVDFTMLTQAEGLKFGIEHFRRRKPHCSGTLIWQYNDCWPCVSWSLVDYDGAGKASLYATTRAYAPVLASFKPQSAAGTKLKPPPDAGRRTVDSDQAAAMRRRFAPLQPTALPPPWRARWICKARSAAWWRSRSARFSVPASAGTSVDSSVTVGSPALSLNCSRPASIASSRPRSRSPRRKPDAGHWLTRSAYSSWPPM
jgi:beta-mannosidase